MARRKESGLDIVASMPWPIGMALGVFAFLGIRYGIGAYFAHSGSPIAQGLGQQLSDGALSPLAWIAMLLCWVAAGVSFLRSKKRKRLLETQSGLESVANLGWREFEMLVGEAYRRQGYTVEETGLGGADGGIDLVLRRDGNKTLVQCKQWRTRQISAPKVREMWGLLHHHGADSIKIVGVGEFTRDAAKFAEGKRIELVNGDRLVEMVRSVQSAGTQATAPTGLHVASKQPECPKCGASMVQRANRKTGESFLGCSKYPVCKGTR
ncbi:membrane protein [Lysobacter helvus]|uniref:Membrane protein n=2 Tax=Lysobacteraceae TaxID=32033 RepID=A0ABM7Q1H0_9GAMM|nr:MULTISPECIES: restriction endonuclease [Lysobacter]BCT91033.1 membrane protein [Lysobacter caseinilyticus]BCT94186.1 membrane protein [Lysobacter helvus]